jgi:type II secretory pathway component PulK
MKKSRQLPNRRPAVVLIAVLVVIVLLSLAAYKYNDWMQAEARAIEASFRAAQARAFAVSGVHYTAALLAMNPASAAENNPSLYQDIEVPSTSPTARPGRFSVLSLVSPEEAAATGNSFRYGLSDEGGKINLNALLDYDNGRGEVGLQILMGLPNMTEDIANAILDWIDPDGTPRSGGAENETYTTMSPPYRCKNGPFDSLEELLLVRGITPQLLFGNDRNRNGVLDADEAPSGGQGVDLGWAPYLTVYSREVNATADFTPRLFINDNNLQQLRAQLEPALGYDLTTFIMAYRLFGGSSGRGGQSSGGGSSGSGGNSGTAGGSGTSGSSGSSGSEQVTTPAEVQAAIEQALSSGRRPRGRIRSLWQLVNASVNVTIGSGRQARTLRYPSPLSDPNQQRDLLPRLFDSCTTNTQIDMTPRVNINTASPVVLAAVGRVAGLSDADIENILNRRSSERSAYDPVYATPTWLLTDVNLNPQVLQRLDRYFTTSSQVYRFQVLGTFDGPGPTARVEAIVDANQGRPRIVYFRDLTELGKGF